MKKQYELKMNETHGFFSVHPLPSDKELNEFYEKLYYQNNTGQYSKQYTNDEITFFQNDCRILERFYKKLFPDIKRRTCLDIGCGEGFQSNYFFEMKWGVTCCDYSDFGLYQHNPHLIPYLIKGDLEFSMRNLMKVKDSYSKILLKNVLEHVLSPESIINKIKKLMDENTILFIDVPNDYSAFQEYLIDNGYTENTWFCPPQHLHYFQFNSLKSFLEAQGLEIVSMQGGWPIEQFLLNKHSNYFHNKNTGKEAHFTRCKVSNFLISQDLDAYISLRETYANLSFGRDIIMIVKLRLK